SRVGAHFWRLWVSQAEEAVDADQSTLRCPGCGGDMRHERLSDKATIFECSGCGSAWLTPKVFDTLVTDREARGATGQNGAAAGGLTKAKPIRVADTAT